MSGTFLDRFIHDEIGNLKLLENDKHYFYFLALILAIRNIPVFVYVIQIQFSLK